MAGPGARPRRALRLSPEQERSLPLLDTRHLDPANGSQRVALVRGDDSQDAYRILRSNLQFHIRK